MAWQALLIRTDGSLTVFTRRWVASFPGAMFVNTNDMLERLRVVKSPEEIAMLRKASGLGDLMLEACRQTAKPGIRECEVYGRMMEVMIGNGERNRRCSFGVQTHTLSLIRFGCQRCGPWKGDVMICEMHPKYGGYCTHVERTFCLGKPEKRYLDIYEVCLEAYSLGWSRFFRARRSLRPWTRLRK